MLLTFSRMTMHYENETNSDELHLVPLRGIGQLRILINLLRERLFCSHTDTGFFFSNYRNNQRAATRTQSQHPSTEHRPAHLRRYHRKRTVRRHRPPDTVHPAVRAVYTDGKWPMT